MYRIPKVNELIKQELGKIILQEEDFGQDVFVTITEVQSSGNLQNAAVKISVLPANKAAEILKKLNRHIFNLQKILDKKLYMRPIPKIRFIIDEGEIRAGRIDKLINQVKNEKGISGN